MTQHGAAVTVTALAAATKDVLEEAGFNAAEHTSVARWRATTATVYEDPYSVVLVAVYETWAELAAGWEEDQAGLVTLISEHFSSADAKSWEGYLVLLTPSVVPARDRLLAIDIQRNTLHVRKLLAGRDHLQSPAHVRQTLLPLLPLENFDALEPRDVLDALPSLLEAHGVAPDATRTAIAAFRDGHGLTEEIHTHLTGSGDSQS